MGTTETIERLDRQRNRMLAASLLTFSLWWAAVTLREAQLWTQGPMHQALVYLGFAGWIGWTVSLILLALWTRAARAHGGVLAALNDELVVRNRGRSAQFAFWVTLVGVVLGRTLLVDTNIPPIALFDMLLWLVFVSKIGGFLWFSRGD